MKAVQAWLNEQYPEIEKRAKAEGGEIHWGDETALVNTDEYVPGITTFWQRGPKSTLSGVPATQPTTGILSVCIFHKTDRMEVAP
jgi:hypothetical protein